MRPRMRLRLAACAVLPVVLCSVLWLVLPLGSQGASPRARAASLQDKIHTTQSKIGRRKGTEHVLTSDIAQWSSRIERLQGRISTLQARQNRIQSDLDARRAELIRTQDRLRQERARLAQSGPGAAPPPPGHPRPPPSPPAPPPAPS